MTHDPNIGPIDPVKTDAYRWMCALGRLCAGLETNVIWNAPRPRNNPESMETVKLRAVQAALRKCNGNRKAAAALLGISRTSIYNFLRGAGMTLVLVLGMIFPASSQPPLPAAALAPQPQRVAFLEWQVGAGTKDFQVLSGPARGHTTNAVFTSSNRLPVVPGVHYAIRARDSNLVTTAFAYWPSNRIAELWLVGYGAGLKQATNIARLTTYTNVPPERMRFWGVQERTSHYE